MREEYCTAKSVKGPMITEPTLMSTKTSTQKNIDILARRLWRTEKRRQKTSGEA